MTLKTLVSTVCQNKENMVKLNNETLKKYKAEFYSQSIPKWKLDLLWEYIWGDISLEEVKRIFKIN